MSNIRKHFTSRFKDGVLLELDFSQLEIYTLAFLSGDETLRNDLLSGKDLHDISAELLYGKGFTPKQRKIAKQLSFQLQYGAGAKSMAEKNNIPISEAKRFIDNYYARYPMVRAYQEANIASVKHLRELSDERTPKGVPAGKSVITSISGRRYTFIEQDAPEWMKGVATSFSPTQIKNYPIQGFATGDIVPMILGKLYREMVQWVAHADTGLLMINTVHDSVLFDCRHENLARGWGRRAKEIMEDAPKYLKELLNIDFDLPLPVEASVGKNWMEMEELTL